jgi:hypothetical protein
MVQWLLFTEAHPRINVLRYPKIRNNRAGNFMKVLWCSGCFSLKLSIADDNCIGHKTIQSKPHETNIKLVVIGFLKCTSVSEQLFSRRGFARQVAPKKRKLIFVKRI